MLELELGGKTRTLSFGNYGIKKFEELANIDLLNAPDLTGLAELEMTSKLIYSGLFGYYTANSKELDFTLEEVIKWCDEVTPADQYKVINGFSIACLSHTQRMLDMFKALAGESEEKKK
jgi:hypothetical protein